MEKKSISHFPFRCEPSSCPQGHYIYVGGTRKKALLLALSVEEIYSLKHGFPPPKFARSNNALEKKNPLFMSGGGRSIKKHRGRRGILAIIQKEEKGEGRYFQTKREVGDGGGRTKGKGSRSRSDARFTI